MNKRDKSIKQHYGRKDLDSSIIAALEHAGKEIKSQEDTSSFDEFHIRGREATIEIAELAGFSKGMKVLDLGSGIGGPARTIASEFGCFVTGIDLVGEYSRTAEILTERTGLSHMVTFKQGDMTDLPYEEGVFDAAITVHTQMNIENKTKLFEETARVLRTGGIFAIYEICSGSVYPQYFPVPWAGDRSISFLVSPDELREMLRKAGFKELKWRDVTALSLNWFREQLEALASRPKDGPPLLGLNLLMGKSTSEKLMNVYRNLEERRISVVQGVFQI